MSELQEALSNFSPIPWSDVPQDSLSSFLKTAFTSAEIAVNSVPFAYPTPKDKSPSTTVFSTPDSATNARETLIYHDPTALDERYAEIQKAWGKPIKQNPKDNPLNVSIYKLAASDRHGAWFARRSIHQGLSFPRWKKCMRREFIESLKVQKGPGSGAIRGLSADNRLEQIDVDGVGRVEAWQISADFPGPVDPREFITLLLTSDNTLGRDSAYDPEQSEQPPRHFMVISRPTTHDQAPTRRGLVRGYYESIEMIREIPDNPDNPDLNPIEWIMVTRSDPGGGIPKFMVERGTPGSILADVPKFLDWAISKADSLPDSDSVAEAEVEKARSELPDESQVQLEKSASPEEMHPAAAGEEETKSQPSKDAQDATYGYSSLLGSLTSAVGSTVSGYLPYFYHAQVQRTPSYHEEGDVDEDASMTDSTSSSSDTFKSAAEADSPMDAQTKGSKDVVAPEAPPEASQESLLNDNDSLNKNGKKNLNQHEKELEKLRKRREDLDSKMAKAREDSERKNAQAEEDESKETSKQQERLERERKKAEEKFQKQIEKLEERRKKEAAKAEGERAKQARRLEERRKKAKEKDSLLKTQRERDEARERLNMAVRENDLLREQLELLQRENTSLVAKLGSSGQYGTEAIRKVREESLDINRGKGRSSSHVSQSSKDSKELAGDKG